MVTRWMAIFLSAVLCGAVSTSQLNVVKPDVEGATVTEHQQNESTNSLELYRTPHKTPTYTSYAAEKLRFEKEERAAQKRIEQERQTRYLKARERLGRQYQRDEAEKKKKQANDDKLRKQTLRHVKAAAKQKSAAVQLRTKEQAHKAGTKEIHRKNMKMKETKEKYDETLQIWRKADRRLKEIKKSTLADRQAIERQKARAHNLELANQYAKEVGRKNREAEKAFRAAQADFYGFPTAPPLRAPSLPHKPIVHSLPKLPPLSKIKTAAKIANAAGPIIADAAENIADVVERSVAIS